MSSTLGHQFPTPPDPLSVMQAKTRPLWLFIWSKISVLGPAACLKRNQLKVGLGLWGPHATLRLSKSHLFLFFIVGPAPTNYVMHVVLITNSEPFTVLCIYYKNNPKSSTTGVDHTLRDPFQTLMCNARRRR